MDANLKIISNNEELYDSKQINKKLFDLKEAHLAKNQDDSKSEEEDEEGSDLDLESEKEEDEQINVSKFARLSNKENKEEEIVLVENQVRFRNKTNRKRTNELDSIRFSMYNIQNSQLNEIDAILNELNQLQTEINLPEIEIEENCIVKMPQLMTQNFYSFNNELNYPIDNNSNNNNLEGIDQQFDEVLKFLAQTIDGNDSNISSSSPSSASLSTTPNSDSNSESKLESNDKNKRNSSDSAFIETVSMPSSVSFSALNQNAQTSSSSISEVSNNGDNSTKPNQNEAQKAELIRIALEKLKEANIKKLIVKAYTDDGCAKSVIIDETMKVYDVLLMLFSKNHVKPSVNYCIVEYMPKFNMERIFEDHENLVEAMTNWSRDSDNQIFFTERTDKYDLFLKPELYLTNDVNVKKLDEFDRNNLVIEFFQNIGSPVPELEGPLYIKTESKKSWKKYYCVLRQSGLYFIPKGKSKKEMQSLFNFDKLDLYLGLDWKKELKSPTDSCFALKYPQVQKKSSKYIKYICCENQRDMKRWINGIRIAKFGKQLYENYKKILDLIEINKTTGRLPVVNNRRLSTNNNNNNQRPNSSYSLGSNPQNEEESPTQQTLLIRKESKNDESLFKNNVKNNRTNQIKQPNLAYTDQLKSLIQSKTNFQSNQMGLNSGKSWQNILTPISVTTNLNNQPTYAKSSCCLTSSPNQKTVKIPVTTDLTKQLNHKIADSESNLYYLKNVKIQRNFELEAEVSDKNCHLKINSTSLNLGDFTTENFYDLPLAPNDPSQTQENQFIQPTNGKNPTCVTILQNNVINRNSRGMSAHVAPKPLKRYNSTNESELTRENRVEFTRKKSIDSISSFNNRNSSQINGSMASVVDSELSTILARQKKKIEESEGTNKQQKIPSPPITKKPPPPPRNDRMNITRKLSIDNGRYMNLNL
ncbi:unnamed protein product [Brachionus calyciflorus]|uniref:Uncharacterized protein n=1 Tax=Brachionus calyciflorus TaxID=104777 RepID=A0A813R4W9_9BILA|nr:unnamed protein product [Brachionus calyciflorus]